MKSQINICVIGCGAIANAMHGPSFAKCKKENPAVVLAACCDVDITKAETFKNSFGFLRAYNNTFEMLDKEKPDAVCLLTPVEYNAEIAEDILLRGIPLIMEKPPGRNREEVLRLIDAAEKTGVLHRVAFNRRFSPLVRRLKDELTSNFKPEDIQNIQYDMFRINRLDEDFSTTAIHAIDAAKFISGSDYEKINFTYRNYPEYGANVADIHIDCKMKSGARLRINVSPVTGINLERAVINLHDNTFFLDYMGTELGPAGSLVKVNKNNIVMNIAGDDTPDGKDKFEREGFYFENKSFFDAVIKGDKISGELSSCLQSVEVADCIRKRKSEYTEMPHLEMLPKVT